MNAYFDAASWSTRAPRTFRNILAVICLLVAVSGYNFGCTAYKKVFTAEVGIPAPCAKLVEASRELTWERRYSEALERLDEATDGCGQTTELRLLRGDIFYRLERWQEAALEFDDVLVQDPLNHQAVVHRWFIDAVENGFDETDRSLS